MIGNNSSTLVFVNTSFSWGWLEMNTVRLAKWMSERTNVYLLCQKGSSIAEDAVMQNIPVVYISKKRQYFPVRSGFRLAKAVKRIGGTHIIFCDNKDMSLCCWGKFFFPESSLLYQQNMQIGKKKKDLLHTVRYKMLDIWISPLTWLAEEIKTKTRINLKKIVEIPLGIETKQLLSQSVGKTEARKFWNIETELPVVGIIGRLDRQKNQHLLIKAVKSLKDRGILVNLLIVGEPTKEATHQNYEEELQHLTIDLGIDSLVHFRGFTNKVATFYEALDVFVMATNGETYGMVTIEAMLFDAAVVASNSGGSPELLKYGELGNLFEPDNVADLANRIAYVLNHKEEIKEKTNKAKQYIISNFDYQSECEQIMNLIKELN